MELSLGLTYCGAAIGSGVTPLDIADLDLWLDGADQNSMDITPPRVTSWNDKSGNGNDCAQATEDDQPLFIEDVKAGRSSVWFDGITDFLTCINDFQSATAWTFFIVCSFSGTSVATLFANEGPGVSQINLQRRNDAGSPRFDIFLRDTSGVTLRPFLACPATDHCLLTLQYQSGSAWIGVNGANYTEFNSAYVCETLVGSTNPFIGATGASANYPSYIDEIIAAPSILSDAKRADMDRLLINKWEL